MPHPFGLALLAALTVPVGSSPWQYDGTRDGIRVESRPVPGFPYRELRISTVSAEALQSLCDAVFYKGHSKLPEGRFKKREILRETDTERWTYEQISVPVVSDRDYVMHIKLDQPASQGRCQVSFRSEDDPSRPPVRGFVRIPLIRGHWDLVEDRGVVMVSYEIFSDPGGHLPAFLVTGGQRDAAVQFMKTILARASAADRTPR